MIANIILGLTLGVLVTSAVSFGRWSARRDIRRSQAQPKPTDRQKRLDARIAAERNPGRRAAWRMIRNDELGDL